MERIGTRELLSTLKGGAPHRKHKEFLALLQLRRGSFVSAQHATDYIWGDAEDGGPLYAFVALRLYIMRLRAMGQAIDTRHRGMRLMPEIKGWIKKPASRGIGAARSAKDHTSNPRNPAPARTTALVA
jgi:hypothetical protein